MAAFWTIVKQAFANLGMNGSRTILTMFGIVWGIATVIILVSLFSGFHAQNTQQMENAGVNMLVLEYSNSFSKDGTRYHLKADLDDADYIAQNCPFVSKAVPQVETWTNIAVGQNSRGFRIVASSPEIAQQLKLEPDKGRFFNTVDYDTSSKSVVLGYRAADTFFGSGGSRGFGEGRPQTGPAIVPESVGKTVSIFGQEFLVIGQLPRQRSHSDWSVYMPLTVFKSVFGTPQNPIGGSLTIYATLDNPKNYDAGVVMVRRLLAARHGFDPQDESAVRLRDFAEWRKEANVVFLMFFIVFYVVGLLTLTIGAVGVMNVMLVSVQERTREIGLRKALGATPSTIITQFVFETLTITIAGGIAGMALGLTITGILNSLPLPEAFPPPVVSLTTVIIAAASNVVVGLFASILPARRAAALDPITALRAE